MKNKQIRTLAWFLLFLAGLGPLILLLVDAFKGYTFDLHPHFSIVALICWTALALAALGFAAWSQTHQANLNAQESHKNRVVIDEAITKMGRALLNQSSLLATDTDAERIAEAILKKEPFPDLIRQLTRDHAAPAAASPSPSVSSDSGPEVPPPNQ